MVAVAFGLLVSACHRVIVPKGEPVERAKAAEAEGVFAVAVNKRPLLNLTTSVTLPAVLEYAFNSNGDIEAAYREWRAAIERVPQAGALPDPRLDFSVMFGPDNLKSFSSFVPGIRLMATQDFPARGKRAARAELALDEAQAAGERFRAAKYRLQKQVVQAYADAALNESLLRQTSETLRLLREAHEVALHRFHVMAEKGAGEGLGDLRKIEVEIQTAESEQRSLHIERDKLAAQLNGILNRPPDAALGALVFPAIARPGATDADLFARAVRHNPELAALRKEIEARGAAQALAELEKRPDYGVGGGIESLSPALTAGLTLPVNRARIRAAIAEALAMRRAAESRLRAASSDVQARVVMALAGIRDAERILADYRGQIIPKTRELLQSQITTYGSGGGDLLDILDTQRLLVDFQRLILRAETDRLRLLAELEEAMGEDLFAFVGTGRKPSQTKRVGL
ncbi:TolC family protein [Candidatus Sumerlaeota bacterium]|nr:TolC family protein [Candidatus Sumerlaeota bacterium]